MPSRRRVPVLVPALSLAILAAGCGSFDGSPAPTVVPVATTPAASPVATERVPPSPTANPSEAVAPPPGDDDRPDLGAVKVALDPVIEGLDQPLFVVGPADGTGRLYVAEQPGVIRVVEDGTLRDAPFLDITDRVRSGGERGLLGLAFPPAYGTGRDEFYVHYSDLDGNTMVSSFRATGDDLDTADPASERTILTQEQPYANHNGGWIGFDQDGMLLIGLGDGGSGGDPENRASDLGTMLGKLLRIDVLGAADKPYAIPEDNPFVAREGARPEILHYGLRNPFRDSVDLATGDIWIGDVGQGAWEEVDVAPADARGLDFGWRRWEGRHCYDEAAGCDETGVTMPITEYPHADGCSVIGGVVYRGDEIAALRGAYLFGDYCSGRLWAIDAGLDGPQAPILLLETGRQISSIGLDEAGEVWVTDLGGTLLRLVPG
ncbi:MAG TPA: PQQ-dependent sugar dehydrogenase [Candidatus Limnocylindrales bacterium]|nr:PQQ-dependent sugar dehydrogenase [Candidatus Limnocylindrales bacterium]